MDNFINININKNGIQQNNIKYDNKHIIICKNFGKKWESEEDKEMLNLIENNFKLNDIAEKLERTNGGVINRLRFIAQKLYNDGMTIDDIKKKIKFLKKNDIEQCVTLITPKNYDFKENNIDKINNILTKIGFDKMDLISYVKNPNINDINNIDDIDDINDIDDKNPNQICKTNNKKYKENDYRQTILNYINESNKKLSVNVYNKQYIIDIYSKKDNKFLNIIKIDEITEDKMEINYFFDLDWIIDVSDLVTKHVVVGDYAICILPEKYNGKEIEYEKINILNNNYYLYTGHKQYVRLISKKTYDVEIDKNNKKVWIGKLCDINFIIKNTCLNYVSNLKEKMYNKNDNNINDIHIIYGRCKESMEFLDNVHREYINNKKLLDNKIIAIKSVAGSGKTTTLLNIAKKYKNKKILYLAFNKSLISEINDKLCNQNIKNLYPMTFDALIYNIWKNVNKIGKCNVIELNVSKINDILPELKQKSFKIKKYFVNLYEKFCNNVDFIDIEKFSKEKIILDLWDKTIKNEIVTYDGLKKQALINHWCKNKIDNYYDLILIDETQDFNMVMLKILLNDTTIPKIFVGDPKQAIYQFRGCINAFDYLPDDTLTIEFYSTFRIGNPACDIICDKIKNLHMISKNKNGTEYIDGKKYDLKNKEYVYLFRSWSKLLKTAITLKQIWIYNFDKQKERIMKLFDKVRYMDDSEITQFEDDLPYFIKSLTKDALIKLLDNIENNIVEKEEALCHIYTIHSYKGLESPIIKLADDISEKEINLYYVALTRGTKVILY